MKKYFLISFVLLAQISFAQAPQGLGEVNAATGEAKCNSKYFEDCGACKKKCLQIYQSETRDAKEISKDILDSTKKTKASGAVAQ